MILRRTVIAALAAVIIVSLTSIAAHETFRVVGTVVAMKGNRLEVKTTQGRTIAMTTNAKTKVTRDKKPVKVDELKAGISVVVNGLGDSIDKLTVIDVRIVPARTK